MKPKQITAQKVWAVVYFLLATLMYHLRSESFTLFGIDFMLKFLISAVITLLSVCIFLVQTNLPRAWVLTRSTIAMALPHLFILAISVPLWVTSLRQMGEIRGGLFNQLYQINAILSMAGMVYVLGEKSIWINLAAILAANSVEFVRAIQMNGLSAYLQELRTLIVTFADETGPIIINMEVHELTFALGVYVTFFILSWKTILKKPWMIIMASLAVFYFLSGFKRIGVFAVAIAVVVGILLWIGLGRKKRNVGWIACMGLVAALMVLVYVALINWGFMTYLQERWGIDLMGRAHLLEELEGFYGFGPSFMGYGAGFAQEYVLAVHGAATHNDIIVLYVDIGFWGLIVWGILMFCVRPSIVGRAQNLRSAVLCFCYSVYLTATAMTDNTFYYVYVSTAIAVLTLAEGIENVPDELPERAALAVW